IMSDGTNALTFLDPKTLKPVKTLNVTNGGYTEDNLNELEYIKGFIYANIWTKNYIVKIDPTSGKVVGLLNLASIAEDANQRNPDSDVLNGIAYDSITDKIFVTGKLYRDIYEIDFPH
ncbi:MAG: glutaminyl-peptide cyclotransferase, partial [Bacteroidetes bacterium]|nr:glutaminyl-peptide cyclotransferase [Bacteroidota bacterium]